jgi:hypothetical protein
VRIFVSYASERRSIAERVSLALRSEGHEVFFDRSNLPEGEAYDARIREAIAKCDLFLFLISPESVESGAYTLSELRVVHERFPVPGNHVLPIEIAPVPIESVPNYLRTVTFLQPTGDLTADVLARVAAISEARRKRRRKPIWIGVSVLLVAALALFAVWHFRPKPKAPTPSSRATLLSALSVFESPDQNSEIVAQARAGEDVTVTPMANPNWVRIRTPTAQGWAMVQDLVVQETAGADSIKLGQGYGYQGSFWKLFFTSPQPKGAAPNRFGIDMRFADALGRVRQSLDIAVFEFNNTLIGEAILNAHRRGVRVRIVTDGRFGGGFDKIRAAGIPVVSTDSHSGLMHNKFAVLDDSTVWTGSWNYTDGATYNNNENAIALDGRDIAARYEEEFNRLFNGEFGAKRPKANAPAPVLSHGVRVFFSPDDPILPELMDLVGGARHSVTFLTFAFTVDELSQALIRQANAHVVVRGVFERSLARGSRVAQSLCGQSAVQWKLDTNRHNLHHDVFVIDDQIVITGSLNFSHAALERNDENVVVIPDPTLAKKYLAEFDRLWATADAPDALCRTIAPRTASSPDAP